ncbi:hypothetical protein N7476_000975 [Penicillium atrosanguineum]|uniref:PRISE-like Rossmann-fold domain-containing protein n=1 Tax=Penicillium atrosanguineum TaxID=1132637 RepID=A0A9W9QHS7_9EURO|nr:hypothetical protein N7526_000851 [Penicillium atrosanguineum]KAJ5331192.1 hypothetical protein N7476_000975 [Penicillium atrosanguineum]
MSEDSKHAIVYGASGIIGWALVDQLLSLYPQAGTFSKVTAVTNRPIDLSDMYWPEADPQTPALQLVSGVDLRHGDGAALANSLKTKVDIESVTHVYYLVFTAVDDNLEEVATNRQMFRNVIDAHSLLSPRLEFVAFPGGTRASKLTNGYGIYAPGGIFTPPLQEDMVNNLPSDYAKTVVYTEYRKLLNAASEGQKWTWCEVCPDAIIGFTPNGSQFSLALHWAQYLSLYAYNHSIGPGVQNTKSALVEVSFPGNIASANSLFSPASSKTIARFMIYASMHPKKCGSGQLFNIADNEVPCKYGELWLRLAKWFGLVGKGPAETSQAQDNTFKAGELPQDTSMTPGEYVAKYRDAFAKNGCPNAVSRGVGAGNRQLDSVGYWLTFDRQMSLKKLKESGFEVDKDPAQGWLETFEMFRKAGLIL